MKRLFDSACRSPITDRVSHACASLFVSGLLIGCPQLAPAAAIIGTWPVEGPNDSVAVGAARLSGIYAVGDATENKIEVRDIRRGLRRTISVNEIQGLLPWMSLDGGPDGPSAIAVSDSGRQLFILVHDDVVAGDGGASDGVILYDTFDNTLQPFARVNLANRGDTFPLLAAKHFKGKLYVGTAAEGIKVFSAGSNDLIGTLLQSAPIPDGSPIRGLAIDPDQNLLFAAGTNAIYRAVVTNLPLIFTMVGTIPDIRSIAFSMNYGGQTNAGLYVLAGGGPTRLMHLPVNQARGSQPFNPSVYLADLGSAFDLAATACGRLLVGTDQDPVLISDDSDPLLAFEEWLNDEFDQVVLFCKALVAADGRGLGWVTDTETQLGLPRFHPASPDGACWVVLGLMLAKELRHDPAAENLCRDILVRHAGLAVDGVVPSKTADGIFRHWINPTNGGALGTWDPEFATLSTMKIGLAAARARKYFWTNATLRAAASIIIDGVSNRAAYIRADTAALYFKGLPAGGPDPTSSGTPFNEGILYLEQAAAFEDAAVPLYARWLNCSLWPTAQWVTGKPVTGNVAGGFQSAFVSLYPWLLQKDFRDSATWQQSVDNLWYSQAAWNDANGPRFLTVFSAGTTPAGYNADSLSGHPDDIATFPALLAFCGKGSTLPAVGAYHAYRRGARQKFAGGESILYRRSNPNPSWQPNSAGLPDVVIGAIGIAELLQPGILDKLMAIDMSGKPIRLTQVDNQLELSWPLIGGWRVQESVGTETWIDRFDTPSPYRFNPDQAKTFFRITR